MSKSVAVQLSDASIGRALAQPEVSELRDIRQPLVLRVHSDRQKGTWYLVQYKNGQKRRVRVGYFPTLKTKDVQAMVPNILAQMAVGEEPSADRFETVGDLLTWYMQRTDKDHSKSRVWRNAVSSAITAHLIPRLGDMPLANLTKANIDSKLILPLMGEGLKPSTMRKYWGTLKTAVSMGAKMDLLHRDYMAGMKFVDHVQKRILPKEGRLMLNKLPTVLEQLQSAAELGWGLVVMMLMFATRIGETRQLRWSMVDWVSRMIVIPAELTKTNVTHVLPITPLAEELLRAYQACQSVNSDLLFPSGQEAISSQAAQDAIRLVSKGKWSAHDLRKLARSAWAELGIDYWIGERLLNHKPRGLDAVYIKTDGLAKRMEALELYHEWLKTQGFGTGIIQALQNQQAA